MAHKKTQLDRVIKSLEEDIAAKEQSIAITQAEIAALFHSIRRLRDQQKARTAKPRAVPAPPASGATSPSPDRIREAVKEANQPRPDTKVG